MEITWSTQRHGKSAAYIWTPGGHTTYTSHNMRHWPTTDTTHNIIHRTTQNTKHANTYHHTNTSPCSTDQQLWGVRCQLSPDTTITPPQCHPEPTAHKTSHCYTAPEYHPLHIVTNLIQPKIPSAYISTSLHPQTKHYPSVPSLNSHCP